MTAAHEVSPRARLARVFLEWLDGIGRLAPDADLCLVGNIPGFDTGELPPEVCISGNRRWMLAQVESDLSLRLALVRANGAPLLAFSSAPEDAFQADLRERAVSRRVIRPLARHLLSALAERDAAGLDDERFFGPLCDLLASSRRERLFEAMRERSWGSTVRDADAAAVLCEAAFSFDDRYAERGAGDLWYRWLKEPPLLTEGLLVLAREILERRYPMYAKLFSEFGLEPRLAFMQIARHDVHAPGMLRDFALGAARSLALSDPELLRELLQPAEAAYVAARSPKLDPPPYMLRTAYEVRYEELMRRCEGEQPPSSEDIAELKRFIHAEPGHITALERFARVSRGLLALRDRPLPEDLKGFQEAWRDDFAWLDQAARRLRETGLSSGVRDAWYALRDAWNEAFARRLVIEWPSLFNAPGEKKPWIVSQLLKYVVRPALAESKTFLVVLDGCDVSTFQEIARALDGAGVVLASFDVALSLIPTVTSHARRAIFGGEVPYDGVIAEEDFGANASGDKKAFEGANPFLAGVERRLFLKGDLRDEGAALKELLRKPPSALRLLAAVFNDVDDALSSKEMHVLAERTLERCSSVLRESILEAYAAGWRIIVTADHGHTPYCERDTVATGLGRARFTELAEKAAPPPDSIVFERGVGMPYRIAALHRLGAHGGAQHLGYHGGVSLEEMFVPLAVYDAEASSARQGIQEPLWWDDLAPAHVVPKRNGAAKLQDVRAMRPEALTRYREALGDDARSLAILERLAAAGMLDAAQLAQAVGSKPGLVRLRVTGLLDKLSDAGLELPILIEEEPLVFRWTGPR